MQTARANKIWAVYLSIKHVYLLRETDFFNQHTTLRRLNYIATSTSVIICYILITESKNSGLKLEIQDKNNNTA